VVERLQVQLPFASQPYNDLVSSYEENERNQVKQWPLAGELVEQCEGFKLPKECYP